VTEKRETKTVPCQADQDLRSSPANLFARLAEHRLENTRVSNKERRCMQADRHFPLQ
jgi:hypothetical protein